MVTTKKLAAPLAIAGLLGVGAFVWLNDLCAGKPASLQATDPTDLPLPVAERDFSELMGNSPFTRSLNLSDSLILTGVAKMEGKPVATLLNKESKETYVISEQPNAQGWKMVGISEGTDLVSVTAKIALSGGEVVTVRFDEAQLKPGEAKPAAGPGGDQGDKGDKGKDGRHRRFGGGPPPEVMDKLKALSEEQKNKMREYMDKKMQENPEMSRDERRKLFANAVEKVTAEGRKN